jgi:hypothetical protein
MVDFELTEFQYDTLVNVAKERKTLSDTADICWFAVVGPSPDDTLEKASKMGDQCNQVKQLMDYGLVEDISARFAEGIEKCKKENNRTFYVMAMTQFGMKMFGSCTDRLVC